MAGKNNETNQQAEIRRLALKISKEQIAPYAAEIDRTEAFPWEAIRAIGEAELPGLVVAEKEGGTGEGRAALASVTQEFASACASTALIFTSHVILVKAIEIAGNDGIKRKWLPDLLKCRILGAFAVHEPDSGSNAGAIATKAAKDQNSYVVNGTKFFITSGGEADVYLVLVRTDPEKGPQGMTTLLVEKELPVSRLVGLRKKWISEARHQKSFYSVTAGFPSGILSAMKVADSKCLGNR
jgi:hypothetical protein